jgi:glutamine synthetase
MMDNTDRNRTSPFAFTGNKFEFRAVGSSANCGSPMVVLNTIMAETLKKFKKDVEVLTDKGEKKEIAILHVLRTYISESKRIRFEGDNYSEEWAEEAKNRGLNNFKTTPEALEAFVSDKAKTLFFDNGIFTKRELEARHEIMLEEYVKKVQIEARVLGYLATNHVLPAAINYQNTLVLNVKSLKELGLPETAYKAQLKLVTVISNHIQNINDNVEAMIEARKGANAAEHMYDRALKYCHEVKPYFDQIRYHADKLELVVDDKLWPLPKYRELLFMR